MYVIFLIVRNNLYQDGFKDKITKQVEYALKLLKNNEQITMLELSKQIKKKYKDFNITPQWLGKVLRDNNKTRKRTRHEHFPTTKYNKPVNKKMELTKYC